MSRLTAYAFRRMFTGIRIGQPVIASLGAAVSLIGWLRRRAAAAERRPIYTADLKEGQALRIRLLQGDRIVAEDIVEG